MEEFRDWSDLPDLALSEVLRLLLPDLRSIFAFAATCHTWRHLLRECAPDLRPHLPPLLLLPTMPFFLRPFSPRVARPSFYSSIPVCPFTNLLSSSRGYVILHLPPSLGLFLADAHTGYELRLLLLADALTGSTLRLLRFPSTLLNYHYAALSPSHLLLFSEYSFASLPFPIPIPRPDWTHHRLPRDASVVLSVIDFDDRVLGITTHAQLLEFHLDANPPNRTVQLLSTSGLPGGRTFDRWLSGPYLVTAGNRLLLVLFIRDPHWRRVKVAVYRLDMVEMRWKEVDSIAGYSLFVDCAGRSAMACVDAGSCGVEADRVYVASPWFLTDWRAFRPGRVVPFHSVNLELATEVMSRVPFLSPTWVYPRLFF